MSNEDYTVGELEEMDLRELHDKHFMVAVSLGTRDQNQFACSSLCGPLSFYEMVDMVAHIWNTQQLHAKAMICSKTFGEPPISLDENTIDFIEARHQDIITDGLLDGKLFDEVEYTCKAGFFTPEDDTEEEASD